MCGGRVVCLFVLVCCSLFAVSCVASFVVCFVLLLCLVVACGSGCCVFVRRVVISLFVVCCLLLVAHLFFIYLWLVCVCAYGLCVVGVLFCFWFQRGLFRLLLVIYLLFLLFCRWLVVVNVLVGLMFLVSS